MLQVNLCFVPFSTVGLQEPPPGVESHTDSEELAGFLRWTPYDNKQKSTRYRWPGRSRHLWSGTTTVQPMLIVKAKPGITEVETEAPEADESTPDPFGNIESFVGSQRVPRRLHLDQSTVRIPAQNSQHLSQLLKPLHYKDRHINSCQRHFPENASLQTVALSKVRLLNLPQRK